MEVTPASDADGVAEAAGSAGPGTSGPGRPAQGGALRAGATDDNADFAAFLQFLATWSDQEGVADRYDALDVSDRRALAVVDPAGRPVPGARVHVVDEAADRVVWSGTTQGDGRIPFYPLVTTAGAAPEGGWIVEADREGARTSVRWDGVGDVLTLTLDVSRPITDPIRLDVCFLIDTTGSMGDEIERIKATLLAVTQRLKDLALEFDLHYGAVLYRDLSDAYITKAHPFTGDIEGFASALAAVVATGGGDMPESLNQGLAEAVGRMVWRDGAAKLLFLIADAPPHMDYEGDVRYGTSARAALAKGIRIHAVAASGLDAFGSLVFRQLAQFTRGKFIFIEYGTPAQSAASHGVTGRVKSNNLDDIIYEQIEAELANWGREPSTPPSAAGGAPEGLDPAVVGGSTPGGD
jgi:hypothetical protein